MLGKILLEKNLVDEESLERARAIARNTRTRLGNVLVSEGLGYHALYGAVADHFGLAHVNLMTHPPAPSLLDAAHAEHYLRHLTLPYRKHADKLTLATAEYNDETIDWARQTYGKNIHFVITSPLDIRHTLQQHFAPQFTHQSVMNLYEQAPAQSARHNTSMPALLLCALLMTIVMALPMTPVVAMLALCHVLYATTMLFKTVVYVTGTYQAPSTMHQAPVDEGNLPTYTILIPMYKETESLQGMLAAMQCMDYPPAKLDIKLIFEEDDREMIQAAYAQKPHYHFDIIRVPRSQPRTKPKACNYALRFARGEYVTVYDADDRPDPAQLKKAIAAFRALPEDVVCLQARLNYYNTHDNLLTRLFSLEYTMLFHVLLPGMSRLSMPLMLGGTSNHIALARLRALGDWDPFNVTEDADLGTRLAARGYKTAMIDSDTMEEAPNTLSAWVKQRTRWIKGYMQTWLVHMRRPIYLYRGLRMPGFVGFQCFVALANFCYLTAPIAWAFSLGWWLSHAPLPAWLLLLSLVNLAAYFIVHIATALHATRFYPARKGDMAKATLLYPLYLVLHSIASYFALWQLMVKPHSWNKTTHGLAKTHVANM